MTKQEEIQAAKDHLAALIKEHDEIVAKINEAESLKIRLAELKNGWHRTGGIEAARLKARDIQFPVFDDTGCATNRIIKIDDKWIYTRRDGYGDNEFTRYKKDTGRRERSRGDWNKIDVQEAIRTWESREVFDGQD